VKRRHTPIPNWFMLLLLCWILVVVGVLPLFPIKRKTSPKVIAIPKTLPATNIIMGERLEEDGEREGEVCCLVFVGFSLFLGIWWVADFFLLMIELFLIFFHSVHILGGYVSCVYVWVNEWLNVIGASLTLLRRKVSGRSWGWVEGCVVLQTTKVIYIHQHVCIVLICVNLQ